MRAFPANGVITSTSRLLNTTIGIEIKASNHVFKTKYIPIRMNDVDYQGIGWGQSISQDWTGIKKGSHRV